SSWAAASIGCTPTSAPETSASSSNERQQARWSVPPDPSQRRTIISSALSTPETRVLPGTSKESDGKLAGWCARRAGEGTCEQRGGDEMKVTADRKQGQRPNIEARAVREPDAREARMRLEA